MIKLMAVTDDRHDTPDLLRILLEIHPYVDRVQIREKKKPAGVVHKLCRELIKEGLPAEKLWINDRVDAALLLGLKQVHVPGHGLPLKELKRQYPELKIGAPVHSFEEAVQAEAAGAAYVLYGHCFPTASKQRKAPQPLSNLGRIRQNIQVPMFGIGGITKERLAVLKAFELDGAAVMSGIFSAKQPLEAVKELRKECLRLEAVQ
ncbi:thiazole tautomerase (transcriptional regulator TenI) [Terribacillus halophilus]|uniref:Thiazole tautomerase (Transcriptional regulator TenI) n=1 Tax=Terribacillus halophilus TaxID=361279 RepID=A0A1G6T979_9BACI|nr:thiamine phosphate synthase [Terribacillus halophilus]SDD25573.1 thiazole tautomerase (transcriptional regulator TenI) [Terribacillus halophilus]